VLGVLAGEDLPPALLSRWAESADKVVAADRGADLCLQAGITPDLVVGDLDSISEEAKRSIKDIRLLDEQDTTDADKLLQTVIALGLTELTLTAIEGDLPDHALAVLHSAARSPLRIRFAYRRGIGWLLRGPTEKIIESEGGRRVSLLPITECSGVSLLGVQWPLSNANLHVHGLSSVSNRSEGPRVMAKIGLGVALLFAEYSADEVPFW
jgi:thiamine pyrophosphokinase